MAALYYLPAGRSADSGVGDLSYEGRFASACGRKAVTRTEPRRYPKYLTLHRAMGIVVLAEYH